MAKIGIVKFLHISHGSNPHEHNVKLEFVFKGKLKGDFVGGLDFHDLQNRIDCLLNELSGKYLPDVHEIGHGTMENLACYLIKKLDDENLSLIRVWEDIDRYVEIKSDEVE